MGFCFVLFEVVVSWEEEGLTSFGNGILPNCKAPHDEHVAVGFKVCGNEPIIIIVFLHMKWVGSVIAAWVILKGQGDMASRIAFWC